MKGFEDTTHLTIGGPDPQIAHRLAEAAGAICGGSARIWPCDTLRPDHWQSPFTIPTMATSSEKVSALVHHQDFFLPCGRRHEDTHASHSTRDVSRNFFSLTGTGESICSVCMAEEPRPAIQGAYGWTGGRMNGGRWTTGESTQFCRFIKIINCRALASFTLPWIAT